MVLNRLPHPLRYPPEQSVDPDEDDEPEIVSEQLPLDLEQSEERRAAKKGFFPSSIGLTFLISAETEQLQLTCSWGDYRLIPLPESGDPPTQVWQRTQHEESLCIPLSGAMEPAQAIPNSNGLFYQVIERPITMLGRRLSLPPGSRSVSIYLINHRAPHPKLPDLAYAFQATIAVTSAEPFIARPNLAGAQAQEWDGLVADLHYANIPEYAVGHGVSAEWIVVDGACHQLRSAWIPSAAVEKTITSSIPDVELSMERLGQLSDGASAAAALSPLVSAYRTWIAQQQIAVSALVAQRRTTAEELINRATLAAERIERGIQLLTQSTEALDAFCTANRAVARALRRRNAINE